MIFQLYLDEEKVKLILRHQIVPANSKLNPTNKPTDKGSLELMLRNIDSYSICIGGPSLKMYQRTSLNCARKDPPVWRHLNCNLVVSGGNVMCPKCFNLHALFGQKIDRSLKLNASKTLLTRKKNVAKFNTFNEVQFKISNNMTPQTRKKLQQLRNARPTFFK